MKKYFVLSVFIMLIVAFTNVQGQNSATPDKGVLVHGNVRLCNYERGCGVTLSKNTVFRVVAQPTISNVKKRNISFFISHLH